MHLVLERAEVLKRSVDAIAVLIDEAEFEVSQKGLSLKATDPSQIAMVDFEYDKKAFKTFDVENTIRLGLDMDYLNQVMARAKPTDEVALKLDEDSSKLSITFRGSSTRTFSVPLIDISSGELPNPKIEFDATVKVKAGVLQDALKDAGLLSTHLTLGARIDAFFVKAVSSKGELFNETKKDSVSLPDLSVKKECRSMFPLDYLSDMLKAAASDTDVVVKIKENAPVELNYPIGEAKLRYFLAPRIETA
ncbi:MAG: proliferating cell nuclear antigen (pcna) [Candidatus Diapherotrites archaeon]|nr:proliferating cell nuclear antigen (pcna) [Candidatus Diapherotrites archaeon]MDZ4256469.1 proliferating cell nuclear antigen (pcna) [archaeon]